MNDDIFARARGHVLLALRAVVPDLSDEIAARVVLPVRRVLRRRRLLRVGLAMAAIAQLAVGLPAVLGDSIGMAMSAHATHEAAAWNLALAVAFGAAVVLPQRAAGLIPLLGTFLGVLVLLSLRDYADGSVSIGRLSTHAAAVVGLALLVAVDRTERALPPSGHASRAPGRDGGGDTTLRTVA